MDTPQQNPLPNNLLGAQHVQMRQVQLSISRYMLLEAACRIHGIIIEKRESDGGGLDIVAVNGMPEMIVSAIERLFDTGDYPDMEVEVI